MTGHVALVTGGNHGIGSATAQVLAACGARVLITYLRISEEPDLGLPEAYRRGRASEAHDIVSAIHAAGGGATAIEADLADVGSALLLFDMAEAKFGPVDILVNNASGWLADTFTDAARDQFGRGLLRVSAETFDRQFSVDTKGAALLIAEFARRHVERHAHWGRIIGLSSGGPTGFSGEVSYGAAKAALENYTMSASLELAPFGVTANVVQPPVTDTGWVTDDVRRHVESGSSPRRIAAPEDVAAVIAYLASDAARWITGNVIRLR